MRKLCQDNALNLQFSVLQSKMLRRVYISLLITVICATRKAEMICVALTADVFMRVISMNASY